MKNLLLIIPKLSNGGAEKAITNLANSLKTKYNIIMVVFDNSIKEYIPKVKVIDLELPANKNLIKKSIFFIKKIKKIKKIKEEFDIDCCISFLPIPNLINCLTKRKEKVITSIRNMQSKLKFNPFRNLINQITLLKSDNIICVSKIVEEDIKNKYKVDDKKITTIYNMIDFDYIEQLKNDNIEEVFLKNNEITVINIGRLIIQKGQWHLIKAFKLVVNKYPNAKLIILGRGPLKSSLENLVEKLKLEENVYLLDFKVNPYKYLFKSDIFVSTSIYEGMPNVILEAMACELPIVATDCLGGTKEILSTNNSFNKSIIEIKDVEYGILIPKLASKLDITEKITEDECKLAYTIIDLIENKKKYQFYINQSKKRIYDFDSNKIREIWIKLIEE